LNTLIEIPIFDDSNPAFIRTSGEEVIQLSDNAIITSIPDTTLLIDALNSGRIDRFAPRLAPDVAIHSEDTRKVIEGRAQALGYLTSQIEGLNGCDPAGHLAVPGLLNAGDEGSHPCAILYDHFHKSCILRLGMNERRLVERLWLSAVESTLRRARPLEPPAFRLAPILPALTPLR
jgi:hypothetical protein